MTKRLKLKLSDRVCVGCISYTIWQPECINDFKMKFDGHYGSFPGEITKREGAGR